MKIKFLMAAAVVTVVAFTSCKKDDAPTPTPAATKKLKKLTKVEAGITTVFNLSYDATGKLTSYKTADNSEYVLFTYDATGNLTGIEEKEAGFKNFYNYTYQNNKPVSGTFKSWELVAGQADELIEDDVLTYTVANNQVTNINLEMLQAGEETDLALSYAGGNLTKVVSNSAQFPYTATFGFGTHRSAFPKVSNWVLDQAGFSLLFTSNNEMLSASFDFPGTMFDKTVNTTYTYDGAGYVLTSNDGEAQISYEYQ